MVLVSRLRVICDSGFLVGLLVVVAGCAFVCLLSLLYCLLCTAFVGFVLVFSLCCVWGLLVANVICLVGWQLWRFGGFCCCFGCLVVVCFCAVALLIVLILMFLCGVGFIVCVVCIVLSWYVIAYFRLRLVWCY